MNKCAALLPYGENELGHAGLDTCESSVIQGDYRRHTASETPQSLVLRDETDTVIATSELAPSVHASHPGH